MKRFLYYREIRKWVELDEELYLEIRRERQRVYAQKHEAGQCFCRKKKLWLCDGMCDTCEFFKTEERSLSSLVTNKKDVEIVDVTLLDCLTDEGEQQRLCEDKLIYQEMIGRLAEVMPELIEYGRMKLAGKTDKEIARQWGITRTSIYKRIKKARMILESEFEEI